MVGPRTKRGKLALTLAALGALVLLASASGSWTAPGHVPWPHYSDGVPDLIAHPSDLAFRLGAALLGAFALLLVLLTRRGLGHPWAWAVIGLIGLGGVALGLDGFRAVQHHYAFGSMMANGVTLDGFRHGPLNYVELAGAGLLCVAPLAALRASRSTGR